MHDLIQRYNLCAYEIIAPGDVVVKCDRPCMGLYCLEHTCRVGVVEEEFKEAEEELRKSYKGKK